MHLSTVYIPVMPEVNRLVYYKHTIRNCMSKFIIINYKKTQELSKYKIFEICVIIAIFLPEFKFSVIPITYCNKRSHCYCYYYFQGNGTTTLLAKDGSDAVPSRAPLLTPPAWSTLLAIPTRQRSALPRPQSGFRTSREAGKISYRRDRLSTTRLGSSNPKASKENFIDHHKMRKLY